MVSIETTSQWHKLLATVRPTSLQDLFTQEPNRAQRLMFSAGDLLVDLSKHLINEDVIEQLLSVAQRCDVDSALRAMTAGAPINFTEGRAVGHMALRSPQGVKFTIAGDDVSGDVHSVLQRMSKFAEDIRIGHYRGSTGRAIRTIVNIGIGGSELGPSMAYEALRPLRSEHLVCRYVANVDPADLAANLQDLDPRETLFIVASKTFTTLETMANAHVAREWLVGALGESAVAKHFVAVSAAAQAVEAFGIDTDNVFGFWQWVGGRYSVASAIGLSLMIAIGPVAFDEFLGGMHLIDRHVTQTSGRQNVPLMMALINIWNGSVLGARSRAVIAYSYDLRRLPAFLQQLIMESNGKRVRADGSVAPYATSPVIWGESGTNAQHAFMQLLHQGADLIPVDFIGFGRSFEDDMWRNKILFTNMLAQAQALAFGRPDGEIAEGAYPEHREFPGNRPSTIITAPQLTPAVLGQLIALYEHVTFFEGVIWGINSFDQWGVELGKDLAAHLLDSIDDQEKSFLPTFDASTRTHVKWFQTQQSGGRVTPPSAPR